jgi:hypothetical protein|tara:strand:+ start:2346 stop:2570 length:225 start_codon:yes stop_codon:yes gene_type:complete
MAIETDAPEGFEEATLHTDNAAYLYAKFNSGKHDNAFHVRVACECGWYFDEEACEEAAEFFLALADELRRKAAP